MNFLRNKKHLVFYILAIFIISVFFFSYASASPDYYPIDEWQITTPEKQGMRSQILADMMEVIKKNSYSIDSVLIIRNGYIVLDAYFYPFSKNLRHPIHSCTKCIMSALIGIAIEKGHIEPTSNGYGIIIFL